MRTTVEIPDALFRETKAQAARNGTTLKTVIIESLIRHLGRSEASKRVDLPLFGSDSYEPGSVSNEEIMRTFEDEEVADARRFT